MRDNRRLDRLRMVLGISIGVVGCGGGDKGTGPNPPPPPPPPPAAVVTTIEIAPGTVSLMIADTSRLAATVKDQSGAAMTGKTVAWTSGTPTVASVSASGLVTALAIGQSTITAAVDGKQGTAIVTVTPTVVIETAKAVSATIGSLGGSLTTTAGGASYTLEIPAASLSAKAVITMTPVTAQGRLPAEGEFVAGVKFAPDGLTFPKNATLRVVRPVTIGAGKMLVGYLANDTGAVVALTPSTRKGDTLTLSVPHFTIAGWGQFTPPQVALLAPQLPTSAGEQGFINQLVALPVPSPLSIVRPLFEQWYRTIVEPELTRVTGNTTTENVRAANGFRTWDQIAVNVDDYFKLGGTLVPSLQPLRQAGIGLLKPVLSFAIASLTAECPTLPLTGPMESAEKVFGLQDIAQAYGLATPANGLDTPSILTLLPQCAKVINTKAEFPESPVPNETSTLALRYGVQLGGNPFATDLAIKLTLTLSGSTADGTQITQTDIHGALQGPVTPTGESDLVADLTACIHPSLGYRLEEVCVHHQVVREFGVTINGDLTVLTRTGLASLANVSKVAGNLFIGSTSTDPTTSTDLRELGMLTEVGGVLTITGLPNVTSLNGITRLRKVGGLNLVLNRVLADLSSLSSLTRVATIILNGNEVLPTLHGLEGVRDLDRLQLQALPALTSLGGLVGLRSVKALWLGDLPQIQSLQVFRGVAISNELNLSALPKLSTLADLTGLSPTLPGALVIAENPLLTNLGPLANVTSVGDLIIEHNVLLPDLHEFAGLVSARGATISGPLFRNLAGLAKLQHGNVLINLDRSPLLNDITLPALTGNPTGTSLFRIVGSASGCPAGRQVTVSAPLLGAVREVSVGSAAGCSISASFPALATATNVDFGRGVGSLGLGAGLTATRFSVVGTNLTSLDAPRLTVGTVLITDNPKLAALLGGGGRVTTKLEISDNVLLRSQTATTWANAIDHTGAQVVIRNNRP